MQILHNKKANMPETFILIPGRTSDQGCGISEGKYLEKYQREINTLQVPPGDMARLGLVDGDRVRLTGEEGQVVEVERPSETTGPVAPFYHRIVRAKNY